jgi:hypothetical protein
MAEELLNSNLGVRSAGAVGPKIGATGKQEESQAPAPPRTASFHSVFDIVADDESARAKPGATFTHRMPSNHWCVNSYVVFELNATTAGTSASTPALNAIRRVTVRHGPQVQEMNYRPAVSYILSQMTNEEQKLIRDSAGTTSALAQTVVAPLPCWWTPFGQGGLKQNNQGAPLFLLNSPLELEIELSPSADLLATGGTYAAEAYNTVKIVHVLRKSTTSVYEGFRGKPWSFVGYDYQTIGGLAIPATTSYRADLTAFDGSSAGIYFNPITDTSATANLYYSLTDTIDRQEAFINGSSYMQLTGNISPNTSRPLMQLLLAADFGVGRGYADDISPHLGVFVPFGGALEPAGKAEADETSPKYEGSFNLRDATKFEIELRNAGSDPVQFDALNIRYAMFQIIDGDMRRIK